MFQKNCKQSTIIWSPGSRSSSSHVLNKLTNFAVFQLFTYEKRLQKLYCAVVNSLISPKAYVDPFIEYSEYYHILSSGEK